MTSFRKLMVANRGEIAIRVFRSAHELGIRTVAIYSHEDRFALHRFKADEAYQVGKPGEPIRSYLDIDGIVALAKEKEVDAIHPGYGFLSENAEFAGPARRPASSSSARRPRCSTSSATRWRRGTWRARPACPILSGSDYAGHARPRGARAGRDARLSGDRQGVDGRRRPRHAGRRSRPMRSTPRSTRPAARPARPSACPTSSSRSSSASAKHIEVQLLGDRHGNLVHLYERDCSVQRRHQKVVEIAPAPNLDPVVRDAICDAALAIGRQVGYDNAGTVEFLVDVETGTFYFIEVNPRIQVEHTVTEMVTGIDLVKSQILIAQGRRCPIRRSALPARSRSRSQGYAMQCRVTTEDPDQQLHSRLRPDHPLSLGRRPGHPARRRPGVHRGRSSRRFTIRCW